MRVLVVGAGPAGLMATFILARRGIKAELVEKRSGPSHLARATIIANRSLKMFDEFEILDDFVAASTPINHFKIYRNNKALFDNALPKVANKDLSCICLTQDKTERILREKLSEHEINVSYNREVLDVSSDDDGAAVTFNDGETKNYDWVIAADGVRSSVRSSLNIPYEGFDLPYKFFIADLKMKDDFDGFMAVLSHHNSKDRSLLISSIGKDRLFVAANRNLTESELKEVADYECINFSSAYTTGVRQASTFITGRTLLVGDAAYSITPIDGKGMSCGFADALDAANAIVDDTTGGYNKRRKKFAERAIKISERRRTLNSQGPTWVYPITQPLFKFYCRFSFFRHYTMNWFFKL